MTKRKPIPVHFQIGYDDYFYDDTSDVPCEYELHEKFNTVDIETIRNAIADAENEAGISDEN